jgi:membrane fusion protein (multidrug efflux system)
VLVVNARNQVEQRAIQTSSILGDKWIVSSGLNAGDRVIVEGLQKVRAGAAVTAVPFQTGNTNAASKSSATPATNEK